MAYKGYILRDSATDKILAADLLDSYQHIAHASFRSPTGSSGTFHIFGYFEAPATHAALTQANLTQTCGTANNPYTAYAFLVAKEAGAATGGAGAVAIKVSGTSYEPSTGARTTSDTETLVADVTAMTANKYIQGTKHWIGQVTYTIDPGATGHTAYSATFNYGLVHSFHMWDNNITLNAFDATGRAGATDTGFDLEVMLVKPNSTQWAYSAAAFVPGPTSTELLFKATTVYSTESDLANGKRFFFERDSLSQAVNGYSDEGIVVRITTGANNAVESMDMRLLYSRTANA